MNELEPITQETMRRLSPYDRFEALERRKEWLKKVRRQDRLEITKERNRLAEFKQKKTFTTEEIKLKRKEYYENYKKTLANLSEEEILLRKKRKSELAKKYYWRKKMDFINEDKPNPNKGLKQEQLAKAIEEATKSFLEIASDEDKITFKSCGVLFYKYGMLCALHGAKVRD